MDPSLQNMHGGDFLPVCDDAKQPTEPQPHVAENHHSHKQHLRAALSRAIPNVVCRRRGATRLFWGKAYTRVMFGSCNNAIWGAPEFCRWPQIQGLMLFSEGYDEDMLQRAENELRHKLLHTSSDVLVEVLADYFPQPYQTMLQNRIQWTGLLQPKIFLQEMD